MPWRRNGTSPSSVNSETGQAGLPTSEIRRITFPTIPRISTGHWCSNRMFPSKTKDRINRGATIGAYLSAGKQNFNQLQLGVQKRFSSGLSFQAEYQFTRSLDNIDNAGGADNPGNWNLSYGNTPAVRRHWLVFNYIYELPFGRGAVPRLTKALVGGWQVSGISTYGTGTPFSVSFSQTGTGIVGWSGTRADQISGVAVLCETIRA